MAVSAESIRIDFDGLAEWQPAGLRELSALRSRLSEARARGACIVSTNGCFDVLHRGHVEMLEEARALGDMLVVGLNSDRSVRKLKGPSRPVVGEQDRAAVLASLRSVDHVVIFDASRPDDFIAAVVPRLHVKGGDYDADALPEAALVRQLGGQVKTLRLREDRSTTRLLERASRARRLAVANDGEPRLDYIVRHLGGSCEVLEEVAARLPRDVVLAAGIVQRCLAGGGKILVCGNGGSAADAQHFAAELLGRFQRDREPWPAVILGADAATLTAIANDLAFSEVFARQLAALGRAGDVLVALSTSGESENVVRAAETARRLGITVVTLTKGSPNRLASLADLALRIPAEETPLIQVASCAVLHSLVGSVEQEWVTPRE